MVSKTIPNVNPLIWLGIGEGVINNDQITDDLNWVPTMKIIFDFIDDKENLSKVFIAGLSGAAFFLGWNAEHLLSGMGGSIYQFPSQNEPGIKNLFDSLGRKCKIMRQTEQGFKEKIIESIDNEIPVFAVEWFPIPRRGHTAIITGYDTSQDIFYGRIYDFAKSEDYVILQPNKLHYVIIIGKKTFDPKPMQQAVKDSLSIAVTMSNKGIIDLPQDAEKWARGLKAYEIHAEMVKSLIPSHKMYSVMEHFIFWQLEVLYQARLYAKAFLRECEELVAPKKTESVIKAGKTYEEFIFYFESKLKIIFGEDAEKHKTNLLWIESEEFPLRELMETEEGRETFSQFFLKLMEKEKEVYQELRNII